MNNTNINDSCLILAIDIGDSLNKQNENYKWHHSFAKKADKNWNHKRGKYINMIHRNILSLMKKANENGAIVYNCNYTGWPLKKMYESVRFDGDKTSDIPNEIKNIYIVGGSFDQCVMHRPKGYKQLSQNEKFKTNVVLDCCFQSRKVIPINYVIDDSPFKRTNETFKSKEDVNKYQVEFCRVNNINYCYLSNLI